MPYSEHFSLQWRHNGRDSVSNHQPHDCFLNRLFRCRSNKTSKLRVTGLCAGNSPGAGEFPTQMASNAENVSIWWRHHVVEVWMKNYTLQNTTKCELFLLQSQINFISNEDPRGSKPLIYCLNKRRMTTLRTISLLAVHDLECVSWSINEPCNDI